MTRMTIGQKGARVLKFLLGLRHPEILATLATYGFDEKQLQDGWTRLTALRRGRYRPMYVQDPRITRELDEFENEWFPVIGAALTHRYPKVRSYLFDGLPRRTENEVAATVPEFLERLDALAGGALGAEGQEARKFLETRGFDGAALTRGRALVARLGTAAPLPGIATARSDSLIAEEHLWAWYLEWSEIARVAVKNRRLLRLLGFLTKKRGEADEEEDEDSQDGAAPNGAAPSGSLPNAAAPNGATPGNGGPPPAATGS